MHLKNVLKIGALLDKNLTTPDKNVFQPNDFQFAQLLSFALGFSFELAFDPKAELGTQLPNGSWTGFIGMANRSEIDFAVSPMSTTEERLEASDWSYPYSQVPVTFVTLKPTFKTEWMSYLNPFTQDVWICLIASVIAVSITFHLASNGQREFQRILLSTCAAILHNTITVQPLRRSEYCLTVAWLVGATFAIYCYTALLLSFMTIPTLSGVRTIPDLSREVTKGTYQCVTVPGSFLVQTLKTSSNPDIAIIGDDLDQNAKSTDILGTLKDSNSKIPAFVVSRNPLIPLEDNYFVSEDAFFNALLSMPVKKSFCCKKELDRVIHYIAASGIYGKIIDDMNFKTKVKLRSSSVQEDTDTERVLTLGDFKGAFAFLIIGHAFSIAVFVAEKITMIIEGRKIIKK